MAEILIRVISKTNSDPVLDRETSKAGDVIHVAPDGWPWGSAELVNPEWRIVKLPGYDPALLLTMLEPEYLNVTQPDGSVKPKFMRKRKRWFDFSLDANLKTLLLNAAQVVTLNTSNKNKLLAIKAAKPALSVVTVG